MSRDEASPVGGDSFNAPCEFGVDANGKEILVLRELERPGHKKSLAALQEMLDLGVISQVEFQQGIAESQERNAPASASEAKLMEPYKGRNRVIMMEWEKPYMEACVDRMAIGPDSIVLEVGFGLGYSASRIQFRKPKHHVVVECNRFVLEKARKWRDSLEIPSRVHIVPLTWQRFLQHQRELRTGDAMKDCDSPDKLWKFTHVFYDDFPLPIADKEAQAQCAAADSRWGAFISKCVQAGILVAGTCGPHSLGALFSGYLARPIQIDGSIRAAASATDTLKTAAAGMIGRPFSKPFKLEVPGASANHVDGQCTVLEQIPFGVAVPPNCPYLPAGQNTLFIPILHWCRTSTSSGANPDAEIATTVNRAGEATVPRAATHSVSSEGPAPPQPSLHRKAPQRTKLQLPPPKRAATDLAKGPPNR